MKQIYDISNRYGKSQEELDSITRAFIEDLSDKPEDQILEAFKVWRRESDVMPTPANILAEIKKIKDTTEERFIKWTEFKDKGTWEEYKEYLAKRDSLSQDFELVDGKYKLKKGVRIPDMRECV